MNIKATQADSTNWYSSARATATIVPPILPDTVHFDWTSGNAAITQSPPVSPKSEDPSTTGTIVDRGA